MALSRRGKGRSTQSRERDETPTAVRTDNDVASGSAPLHCRVQLCAAVVLCVAAFVFTLFAGLALVGPALHLRLPHGLDTFLHSTTTTVLASTARSPSPKGMHSDPSSPTTAGRGATSNCACNMEKWERWSGPESERFEYKEGTVTADCDFDTVDEFPSQVEFDRKYWNKKPLRVRGGARRWPAFEKWTKSAIAALAAPNEDNSSASFSWFKSNDHHASATSIGDRSELQQRRGKRNVAEYLCNEVCAPPAGNGGTEQTYLFDRDRWQNTSLGVLINDIVFPPQVLAHMHTPDFHERWSVYFLIGGLGSGINFHRHTTAFNGCVRGEKRWFLFPRRIRDKWHDHPPGETIGPVEWFDTIYRREWAGGRSELVQCMQREGDLLYIPAFWWHATISLGEGIGVSGQFLRRVSTILLEATEAQKRGDMDTAIGKYRFVLQHAEAELEGDACEAITTNLCIMLLRTGRFTEAADRASTLINCDTIPLSLLPAAAREAAKTKGIEIRRLARAHVDDQGRPVTPTD